MTKDDPNENQGVYCIGAKRFNKITFYEIKTGTSVRASIRQAIPQLLEYAYWSAEKRADELVIVSHLKITGAAKKYLKFLRDQFNVPLSYKQFDLKTNTLL